MIILSLAFLCFLFWIGLKLTGAIFMALLWLLVELPIALVLWGLGLACCCTILLIPLGLILFKAGAAVVIPG